MLITDIIKKHETSLKDHYRKNGESKLGCTTIHSIKQKVDYLIAASPSDDWSTIYLKELSNQTKEHGLVVKV